MTFVVTIDNKRILSVNVELLEQCLQILTFAAMLVFENIFGWFLAGFLKGTHAEFANAAGIVLAVVGKLILPESLCSHFLQKVVFAITYVTINHV